MVLTVLERVGPAVGDQAARKLLVVRNDPRGGCIGDRKDANPGTSSMCSPDTGAFAMMDHFPLDTSLCVVLHGQHCKVPMFRCRVSIRYNIYPIVPMRMQFTIATYA